MTALVLALGLSLASLGFVAVARLIDAPERLPRRSGAHTRAS